jgi:hypothetical protein
MVPNVEYDTLAQVRALYKADRAIKTLFIGPPAAIEMLRKLALTDSWKSYR